MNPQLNKKVKKYLDSYLRDTKTNSPEHQEVVMLILRGALTDANFHSEAKQLGKYFPKASNKYIGTPMEDVIESKGQEISKMAKWDGHDIIDAFAFYLSMSIGGSFGNRLMSLKESLEDPCWDDYEMVGMKKKNGKEVPNCVPKSEATMDENFAVQMMVAKAIADQKVKNPETKKDVRVTTALKDKEHPAHGKAKSLVQRLKDKFSKKESVDESVNENQGLGKLDAKRGKDVDDNPFKPGTKQHVDWLKGFEFARARMRARNEVSVSDFEIGDFVHFKSKNKTGMVVSVKGNKVTINTPKGKITSDVKDVKVLHQDNVNEAYVIFYAKKKGDKPSQAAYRDKDMAVKFEKDLKKDGYITMMVNKKIKGVDESVNEGIEPQIKKIAYYTGTRPEAVEDFVSKHGLNITKLLKFVEKGKLPERMAIVSALAGKPGNPVQKKIIKQFSESINEDYYKSASDAADAARKYAEKKGFEIDEDDWQTQIAMGGKHNRLRPGVGKTHSFSVGLTKNGKPQRKALNISLYGMDSGKFELTSYIN